MLECPTCKAQCFSKAELNQHEALSHLAKEVKTVEGYTVIKFEERSHARQYLGDGKIEWEGRGWYIVDCDCSKNSVRLLPLDHFIKIMEDQASAKMAKMTCLRMKII